MPLMLTGKLDKTTEMFLDHGLKDIRYFPKGLFPSGNFPRVFSQLATSTIVQLSKRQLPKCTFSLNDNFPSGNFPDVHFPK